MRRVPKSRCVAVAIVAVGLRVTDLPAQQRGLPADEGLDSATTVALNEQGAAIRGIAILNAVVNGLRRGDVVALVDPGGAVWIEESTLRSWQVVLTSTRVRVDEGRRFVALDSLSGAAWQLQPRTMELVLTLPPGLLQPNEIDVAGASLRIPPRPPWSGFFNYDLFGYTSRDQSYGAALLEAGLSGPYGVGIANFAWNNATLNGATQQLTRYDSYWRFDDVANTRTLVLGDAVSRSGAWGRSVRFGGIQYGTNFTLQPNLITYPLAAISGTAIVPSTVDVLLNGQRIASEAVPPGPFTLTNVPTLTGAGDVQLVVRDAFGQQQVISQPLYASRQLLQPGLDDYTISTGALRYNWGIDDFDYRDAFASAYWRRGVTDRVTVELRAEGDRNAQSAGATVDFMPGPWGVFTVGAAASHSDSGTGGLGLVGYEYQSSRFNIALRGAWASDEFRTLGDQFDRRMQRALSISGGWNLGQDGTLGGAWIGQSYQGPASTSNTAVISYSRTVWRNLFLGLSVARSYGDVSQTSFTATMMIPFEQSTSLSADATVVRRQGSTSNQIGATLQKPLPVGEGYGYRVRAVSDDQYEAGAAFAGPYGRYALDVGYASGVTALRGSVAGGVGVIDGTWFAARPIVDSFGLVRVADVPGVRVYQNGSFSGRTNERGELVLTDLLAYAENRITIDDKDVPIDVSIRSQRLSMLNYYRSGAIVEFAGSRSVGASRIVLQPDGTPLPAGASVRRIGGSETYPVGERGEVYIVGEPGSADFVAEWPGRACEFTLDIAAASKDADSRPGPVTCRSRQP